MCLCIATPIAGESAVKTNAIKTITENQAPPKRSQKINTTIELPTKEAAKKPQRQKESEFISLETKKRPIGHNVKNINGKHNGKRSTLRKNSIE